MKIYKVSYINEEGTVVEWHGSRRAALKRNNDLLRQQKLWDRKQISGTDGTLESVFSIETMDCTISKTGILHFLNVFCRRDG
jgi:hypothetical protein